MSQWYVNWNFSNATYSPKENGSCTFWLENTGTSYLHVEQIMLQFDWQVEKAFFQNCSVQVPPNKKKYLTSLQFSVPQYSAGIIPYAIGLKILEYNQTSQNWAPIGPWWTNKEFFVKSIPKPFYRAFVSRGIRDEDRIITDSIVEMINEWDFETNTVGIETITDPKTIDEAVKLEIQNADCFIAIATRRYLDALSGMWRTLEWLHGETGIAYGLNKPLLIIAEDDIRLGGLPGYLVDKEKCPILHFNQFDLDSFRRRLDTSIQPFREWVSTKRSQEFWNTIGKAGLLLLAGGIVGYALGSSRDSDV